MTECKKCGAPFKWALTVHSRTNRWLPVEPEPSEEGSFLYVASRSVKRLSGVELETARVKKWRLYRPHIELCTTAGAA